MLKISKTFVSKPNFLSQKILSQSFVAMHEIELILIKQYM